MPPRRKIDMLPEEQREWLEAALKDSGFSGYAQIATALNDKLAASGSAITIGKSAVHSYGVEYAEYIKLQKEASSWAEGWMGEQGLGDEAQRHSVLFQMLTTVAFKVMKEQMLDGEVDPKDLHFMGKMLKDIMSSAGLREKMLEGERLRLAKEVRREVAAEVDKRSTELGLTQETIDAIKGEILGVKA